MHTARHAALSVSTLSTLALALVSLLPACGDDGAKSDPKGEAVTDPTTVEQGKALGTATQQLTTLQPGGDTTTAQGPIMQVGNSVHALVNQFHTQKLMQQQQGLASVGQGQSAENRYSFENDHLSADLSYDSNSVHYAYIVEMDMPAQDGGRVIDGTFDLDFEMTSTQYNIKYGYAAAYEALALDPAGCAVAGSLAVDFKWDLSGPLYDQLPADQRAAIADSMGGEGRVTVEFGPACGDVQVFGR